MTDLLINFLLVCGFAGIADVLFFEGKIGVFLSKYLSVRGLFKDE